MNIYRIGAICLVVHLCASEAPGCRYTVRDTGFVDIGASPYRLCLYAGDGHYEEMARAVKTHPVFPDSNVKVEWIREDQEQGHPAMKYLPEGMGAPAAVLVSPDERIMSFPLAGEPESIKISLTRSLDEVTSSPKREELLDNLLEAFCIILLIEGEDADENEITQGAAEKAMERIRPLLGSMAKPMKYPPLLMTLPNDRRAQEGILLWGLDVHDGKSAQAAVLYGRGRRIGPVLSGESLNEQNLYGLMRIIGADCECGLDRSWLRGRMFPLAWGWDLQQKAAKELGFDPENPMVKMEVSQIIAPGRTGEQRDQEIASLLGDDLLLGYSEEVIEFVDSPDAAEEPPSKERAQESTPEEHPEEGSRSPPIFFTMLLLGLLVLVGLFFVLFRVLRL